MEVERTVEKQFLFYEMKRHVAATGHSNFAITTSTKDRNGKEMGVLVARFNCEDCNGTSTEAKMRGAGWEHCTDHVRCGHERHTIFGIQWGRIVR